MAFVYYGRIVNNLHKNKGDNSFKIDYEGLLKWKFFTFRVNPFSFQKVFDVQEDKQEFIKVVPLVKQGWKSTKCILCIQSLTTPVSDSGPPCPLFYIMIIIIICITYVF